MNLYKVVLTLRERYGWSEGEFMGLHLYSYLYVTYEIPCFCSRNVLVPIDIVSTIGEMKMSHDHYIW